MGMSISTEELDRTTVYIYNHQQEQGHLPNVAIDPSLLSYSGLDSTAVLQSYSSSMMEHLGDNGMRYAKELATTIGGFTSVPNAVGLGALVISMLIETVAASYRAPTGSHKDLLRRVFAEQKVSELRDLMDEYLKRHEMHLLDDEKLLKDTQVLERQLSVQLTRVRNAILKDGQMNDRAFKQWVNGAAFHIQMLIQLARLERKGSTSARKAVGAYERDLEQLLDSYKALKVSNIFFQKFLTQRCKQNRRRRDSLATLIDCYFCDREFGGALVSKQFCSSWWDNTEFISNYVSYMMSNHKDFTEMKRYFSQTKYDLDSLIEQRNNTFTLPH
ncbi:hypothetical protein Z043_112723 [Scleropages formosus]|uniref:Uncharacterized protein n=1 Tax=Scleropages formosus TaxID=113540 RepID=A0A0P7X3J6_SCLFO|nr:uncharacterized protein LOC108923257 [Scleropages formosus]KPP68584.1 hypothetical protein Z043_112723 [Scleropages formosus]